MVISTFAFHTDPSHGWLKVTNSDLIAVGLGPSDFSTCSYRSPDNRFFYLEEDCDAPRFIEAFTIAFGFEPPVAEYHSNQSSFIRRLPCIR